MMLIGIINGDYYKKRSTRKTIENLIGNNFNSYLKQCVL